MEDFFNGDENQPQIQSPTEPQEHPEQELGLSSGFQGQQPNEVDPAAYSNNNDGNNYNWQPPSNTNNVEGGDDFNDFEEDEVTRKIRQQQERIQTVLRQKSDQEWEEKKKRQEEGRKQLEEYRERKEEEKKERAADNIRKEEQVRAQWAKLNKQAGWKKVVTNVNMRQGEHKGSKDINRMREALMRRREDDQN